MIDFEDALIMILEHSAELGTNSKSLNAVTGDILAEDIRSKNPVPPFDSSAMDGYALRSADVTGAGEGHEVVLAVTGAVHAGEVSNAAVRRRKAVKIMTGAPIPRGADTVIMKEQVTETENGIAIGAGFRKGTGFRKGANIRLKGEEFKKGEIVVRRGTLITPPVAGLLATAGCLRIRVFKKPRVAVVVTGSELRPPGADLKPGQIRDSNSTALSSALQMLGIDSVTVTRVADQRSRVIKAIGEALRHSDIVITVGGISVGDHDYAREAMEAHHVREHFWRIAIKPGKPNYFGTKGKKLVFGLPGNPVSALLSFHLLVKPAIVRITGQTAAESLVVHGRLDADLKKKPGRLEFVRVAVSNDVNGGFRAVPVRGQESHMLSGLSAANGIYRFPKNDSAKRKGSSIPVELIDWRQS